MMLYTAQDAINAMHREHYDSRSERQPRPNLLARWWSSRIKARYLLVAARGRACEAPGAAGC